ncbi:outer membrane beta-barrel protein [Leptotrichia sp. oral taxon 847]|jgi:hypothetical protein|uniref:outer membrane beta-barrel protein n=1 Tax=Leptotrichia sp. oral taxon 847 TaxID=1785996 RepID=UPI0007680C00|nr:outer membrane beta-barrel protein [Leptotrichia sp. oral taxon 847]AMD95168.1 hypothetical protein AXF11_05985 [Leptotrichia sp. oral taxon 847]
MKKLILSVFILTTLVSFAEGNSVDVRAGLDLGSKSKVKNEDFSFDLLKKGFEIGTEYRRNLGAGFEAGAGIFYKRNNFKKEVLDDALVDEASYDTKYKSFNAVPIYATARYNFNTNSDFVPYIKANLGYSINSGKAESNYTGVGTSKYYDIAGKLNEKFEFKNGLYYGLGTGLKYKNFFADLSYNVIRAKVENNYMSSARYSSVTASGTTTRSTEYEFDKDDYKVNNRFVTLSFGYSFEF